VGDPRGEVVTILRRLGTNSAIYASTNVMQKGAAFLLMPLYTLYLDPAAYGILAIVTAVNGFLSIAFTLGLTGAVTRFYFEYQDDAATLAEFWGSIVSFVMLLSVLVGGVLLVIGDRLLRPFIGEVPFWPYVALGVIATFFQPFFTTFLVVLQTRNKAGQYAFISLAHFFLTTAFTVAFVVFLRWGVTGALVATVAATIVFFALSLYLMRSEVRFCLNWRFLREALTYSLPQIPHSLASQTTAMADRLILNSKLGTAAAGIYSVGAMIAMVVEVAANSVNRAYVPLSMSALKSRNPSELAQLRTIGSLVVAGFCLIGAAIGAFGRELVWLLTTAAFSGAAAVIPILVFGGVATAIYYILVNVFFFDRSAINLLPICTLSAAILNVSLALMLVPRFGLIGAAAANLIAQTLAAVLVGVIGRRFDPVEWDYGRYVMAFIIGLGCALYLGSLDPGGMLLTITLKLGGLVICAILLGSILWRRPFVLADAVFWLARRRPDRAAALFTRTKATT
jgi:O-antigen/teichoic acid export membrane protein